MGGVHPFFFGGGGGGVRSGSVVECLTQDQRQEATGRSMLGSIIMTSLL